MVPPSTGVPLDEVSDAITPSTVLSPRTHTPIESNAPSITNMAEPTTASILNTIVSTNVTDVLPSTILVETPTEMVRSFILVFIYYCNTF